MGKIVTTPLNKNEQQLNGRGNMTVEGWMSILSEPGI